MDSLANWWNQYESPNSFAAVFVVCLTTVLIVLAGISFNKEAKNKFFGKYSRDVPENIASIFEEKEGVAYNDTLDINNEENNSYEIPPEDMTNGNSSWRCACEGGLFLPNTLLKSLGGAQAVFRMGSGQCYHKQM